MIVYQKLMQQKKIEIIYSEILHFIHIIFELQFKLLNQFIFKNQFKTIPKLAEAFFGYIDFEIENIATGVLGLF